MFFLFFGSLGRNAWIRVFFQTSFFLFILCFFHVFEDLGVFCCWNFSLICSFIEFCCLSGCLLCPLTCLCMAHSLCFSMFFVSGGPRVCSAVVRSTLRSSSALVLWMLRWSPQCFILSATHLVVFKGTLLTNTGWVFTHHGCQNVTTNLQSWFSPLKK